MEDLIAHASVLFDERGPGVSSPPLPPPPLGIATPAYAYGSAHTKVTSMPASQTTIVRQQPNQTEDFTPKLPPRPANSIHPSARGNPATPTRNNFETTAPLVPGRGGQTPVGKSERPATPIPQSSIVAVTTSPQTAGASQSPPSPTSSCSSLEGDDDSVSDFDMVSPVGPPESTIQTSPPKSLTRTPRSTAPVLPALPPKDVAADPTPSPAFPGAYSS